MPKDLKIGLLLGMVAIAAVAMFLATRQDLSIEKRMLQARNTEAVPQPIEVVEQPRFVTALPKKPVAKPTLPPADIQTPQTKPSPTPAKPDETKTKRFHVVAKGETLSGIAYKYYGSAGKWQKIYNANSNIIKDANRLTTGAKLTIPD